MPESFIFCQKEFASIEIPIQIITVTPPNSSSSISRRSFLKNSALSVGGLVVLSSGVALGTSSVPAYVVTGTHTIDPAVMLYSTYWWYKAKVIISTPNPHGSVTIDIQPAGAEMGDPEENPLLHTEKVGSKFSITGMVDSTGKFTSTKNCAIGNVSKVDIGLIPGGPNRVWACIRVTSVVETKSHITMSGVVWGEANTTTQGAIPFALTDERQWQVKVSL